MQIFESETETKFYYSIKFLLQTQLDSEELPVSSSSNGSENPGETVAREKNEGEISAMETDSTPIKEQTEGMDIELNYTVKPP